VLAKPRRPDLAALAVCCVYVKRPLRCGLY